MMESTRDENATVARDGKMNLESNSGPLIFLVTEDWYFLSHRLPMARAARMAGFTVHVVTAVGEGADAIVNEGFVLHPLQWRRRSLSPGAWFRDILRVRALYREIAPRIVHHVALKPSLVGSLAALGLKIACVNSVAGLGFVFTSRKSLARLLRLPLRWLLARLFGGRGALVVVQNTDDEATMRKIGIPVGNIRIVPGSGVEVDKLPVLPEPQGPVRAAFVGRMLDDKGVRTLVAAHRLLRERGVGLDLDLVGVPDPDNRASISLEELQEWDTVPSLNWLGHVADIGSVWARAHIAVLPSRREGLPKSLLEAASCGRPICATDVPGCRSIARQDLNALLVPPDDPEALADALQRLAEDPAMRKRFGAASRKIVEDNFSAESIGEQIVIIYAEALAKQHPDDRQRLQ